MNAITSKGKMSMSRSEAGRLGALKSKEIQYKQKQERVELYLKTARLCIECGHPIPYENRYRGKFCSRSCSAKFHNRKRLENYIKKTKTCLNCGKEFFSKVRDAKFCCFKCSTDYKKKENGKSVYEHIKKTGCFPIGNGETTKGEVNRRLVKIYLEDKFGHKCSICGNTEWMGKPIPLVVDHIDGDPYNCKVDNFRLVCGNCDMQLDTYKGKNFGHGRSWRKKYTETIDKESKKE